MLHGTVLSKVYGPALEKGVKYNVFAFDLVRLRFAYSFYIFPSIKDNTVITTNSGKILSKDPRDWKFNMPCVPKKINELIDKPSETSKSIFVLFSNQLNLNSKVAERAAFESKIDGVISKLGVANRVPVIGLFATARDKFRKPCHGMWQVLKDDFLKETGCQIKMDNSFFVGDAAGRFAGWKSGKSADWSSVDHKFALNNGLKFYSPEEFFLNEDRINSFDLGRNPKDIPCVLGIDKNNMSHINNICDNTPVMVLAVGSPASGKSTFYRRHLKERNFVHINRDTLKTIPKCLAAVKSAFESKQSVYIDNTNPSIESRQVFIEFAKEFDFPVKCVHFLADEWLCKHLDVFRVISTNSEPLPSVAFNSFRSKYQEPLENEGFDFVIKIQFSAEFESQNELELFQTYLF